MGRNSRGERFWEVIAYIAMSPVSVSSREAITLMEERWTSRTVRRDLEMGCKLKWLYRFMDEHGSGVSRYKFTGPKEVFIRKFELWCHSCKKFKKTEEFKGKGESGKKYRVCLECAARECRKRYRKNKEFYTGKQRRSYARRKGRVNWSKWDREGKLLEKYKRERVSSKIEKEREHR